MSRILYILIAIVMLGFIVTVHEFGHYLVGRLCGIGIVEFSVGFGPKLIGFTRKGIKYSLRLIPLGGYCSFIGEDESNSAPNAMNNQPVWKRFLTVFAGPAMNFVLAFVFCVILMANYFLIAEHLPRIAYTNPDMPAAESGIQPGDVVTSVNGEPISFDEAGMEMVGAIIQSADHSLPIEMVVEQDGIARTIFVTPVPVTDEQTGATSYQIGIVFGLLRNYTWGEALKYSCSYMVDYIGMMLDTLRNLIFHGQGTEDLMGSVGIIAFASDLVRNEGLYAVVNLIFLISLNVGIMNLLPLPALDGGRLIFLIIEGIRRKPIPPEKEGMVHAIGMGLLLMLFVFITYKDIARLIAGI